MLVSIIIPIFNVESYIRRCIESLLSQTYQNFEIILVDDGSPDKCPQICDEYAAKDARIKVIHKQNGGQAEARNLGLDVATGDYILFLDSDDYIHQDTIGDMLEIAEKESADIVQCTFIRGAENQFPTITKTKETEEYDNHSIFYSRIQKIIVWGKLYKRELWDNIRMPVGKLNYEDDATTWKLYYRSKKTVFVNTPYYYYFINPDSTMACQHKAMSLAFVKAYKERISFFEQEGDKLLTDLSRWRFCLPLMLGYMKGNVKREELPVLLKYFRENNRAAISCKKVPCPHRALLAVFSCCPQLFRFIFVTIGKAHTL